MRDMYSQVRDLDEGAYLVRGNRVEKYGRRWAYGYAVPIRDLLVSDLGPATLFTVRNDKYDYSFANHVDSREDASRLAKASRQRFIYDLHQSCWVPA